MSGDEINLKFRQVMRLPWPLFLLLLAFGLTSCGTPKSPAAPAVKTRFVPEAVLSNSELREIVDLAHECGVSEVEEVYSYNIHPSPSFGFGVKSVETVRGREVSFIVVLVDHKKWVRPRNARQVERSIGNLWVESGSVRTNVLTTFALAGGTVRVRLSPGLDLATADRIVELLAAGRISYKDATLKDELGRIDLSKLAVLWRAEDGKSFTIGLSCGELCVVYADVTISADGLTVIKVSKLVS
jgi:hypothetical protein